MVLPGGLRVYCEILPESLVVLDNVVVVVLSGPVVHVPDGGKTCIAVHLLFRINYKEHQNRIGKIQHRGRCMRANIWNVNIISHILLDAHMINFVRISF